MARLAWPGPSSLAGGVASLRAFWCWTPFREGGRGPGNGENDPWGPFSQSLLRDSNLKTRRSITPVARLAWPGPSSLAGGVASLRAFWCWTPFREGGRGPGNGENDPWGRSRQSLLRDSNLKTRRSITPVARLAWPGPSSLAGGVASLRAFWCWTPFREGGRGPGNGENDPWGPFSSEPPPGFEPEDSTQHHAGGPSRLAWSQLVGGRRREPASVLVLDPFPGRW